MKFLEFTKICVCLSVLSSVAFIETAQAVPQKYDECSLEINEPEKSSGFYLSSDCKKAYVLPPTAGKMTVQAYRPTGFSQQRCQAIKNLEEENVIYSDLFRSLADTVKQAQEDIDRINSYLQTGLFPDGETRASLMDQIKTKLKDINEIRVLEKDFLESYVTKMGNYASREGGTGSFMIENAYSNLLKDFRELNPNGPSFVRTPIASNSLSIVDKSSDPDVQKTEMSAVLSLNVPGSSLPVGKGAGSLIVEETQDKVEPSDVELIFGSALSGKIVLSDIGACIVDKELGAAEEFQMKDLKAYIAANAFYEYQVQVERRYSVTFKMAEFLKRVHSQTKKGGFFSRKTVNSLLEDSDTNSWLVFHSSSGDSRFEYTEEDIKEIKTKFIDRAIVQVATAKSGNPQIALALLDPSGANGADQIAKGLEKCPHLYCQIGSAGFKALSAIFGSESATSELSKTFAAEVSETVTNKSMVSHYGSMTFQ